MANKDDVASLREYNNIVKMTFSGEEEAYEFYNNYAKKKGFSIRKSIIRKDLETDMIIFRRYYCSRSGYRENKYLDKPDRKRSGPRLSRCGCPFELCIKLDTEVGKWRVSSYIGDHNHSLEPRDTVPFLRSHCRMNEAQKFEIADFQDSGVCNYQILDLTERRNGGYEDRGFQSKNLYNFSLDHERCTMLADDAESILKYFKERKKLDPDFYSKYDAKDGHLTRLFWADGQSVLDYANFGDVVIFDSTYQLNRYNMVVVPFLGCNHYRSTIIFACGIVSREDKKSYEWLLEALMEAMYQVRPESVITDGDLAMRDAINIVLRDTTHRLCTWHMGENAKKYIRGADVFRMFHKLMSKAYSAKEFEHKWREFEDKASKRLATRNLLSHIYSSKHLWAGAFVSKRVFLGMSTSQRSESINSKLHKYMNCKMSLCKAVQQMERYITRMRTKEAKLDCKASQTEPILTTPVPNLEKSAAFYYTPRIFAIVRKEIEKAIEFVVDQNSKDVTCLEYIVSLRGRTETLATVRCLFLSGRIGKLLCTCSKFECDKIPCSHMFAVLMHLQITFIPRCCVRDRWTITAKSVFPSDRKGGVFKVNEQQQRYHELTKLGNRLFYEASKSSSEYVRTKEYLDEELKRHKDNGRIFKKCKVEKDEVSEDTESMQKIRNPKIVVTKGAPKKKKYERIHSSVEGRKNKCGHCGMRGHNRQTCQHLSQDNDDDNGSGSKSVPGVAVLFTELPEARKPDIRWCLYIFKGGKMLNEPLNVHRQSCYLFGTERRVADIPTDHPSCSKQHVVLQYRQVEKEQPDGMMEKQVRPYLMDLDSTNGTFINDNRMEPRRYYGLCEKDTIKFGNSSWEYVLLRENSSA